MEEACLQQSFFAQHAWLLEAPGQQPTPASALQALGGIADALGAEIEANDNEAPACRGMQLQAQGKGGLDLEIKGLGLKPEEVSTEDAPPQEHKSKKGRVESQQESTVPGTSDDASAAAKPPFEGHRIPPISLKDYVVRIWNYTKVSPICMLVAFTYVDCLSARKRCRVTRLTSHRLLLTAVLLAAKCYEDTIYNNIYFAKVGGITTAELNMLEVEMLKLLDFRVLVDVVDLHRRLLLLEQGKLALCKEAPEASGIAVCYGV